MPNPPGSGALNTATLHAIPWLLTGALLATACASQPRTASDAGDTPAGQSAAAAVKDAKPRAEDLFAPAGGTIVLSPDGDFFADELGDYYLVEVKPDPRYTLLTDGRVMLPPGAAFQLVEKRDDMLVVKIYSQAAAEALQPPRAVNPAKALIADLDDLDGAEGDRLRLVRSARLAARGRWRQGFELADLNGDGHLDVVHGPARKSDGQPKVFLGDGAGGWRLWREARFEGVSLDYGDVAVADFDGDGNLDL